MVTRQIRVSGRVQGVGFRYALCDEAERVGVTGWVRNRTDGTVEALLQGSEDAVDALVAWTRRGPPGARVTDVQTQAVERNESFTRFELKPTL
jgi:acylphosphatase